jgi:hypothetical protein
MMLFARKWMELENIMLSEINQSHKDEYLSFVEVRGNKTRS